MNLDFLNNYGIMLNLETVFWICIGSFVFSIIGDLISFVAVLLKMRFSKGVSVLSLVFCSFSLVLWKKYIAVFLSTFWFGFSFALLALLLLASLYSCIYNIFLTDGRTV